MSTPKNLALSSEQEIRNCMQNADFTWTYEGLLEDGIRIGTGRHALNRSVQRYYEYISWNLLSDDIAAMVKNAEETILDEVPLGQTFVITQEKNGLTACCGILYNNQLSKTDIFVKTVFIADPDNFIWIDKNDSCLVKIYNNANVVVNPPEMRRKA